MFRHLSEKEFQDEEIREALQELTTKKYIDDIEYGNMYLRYGFEKGRGIKRLIFANTGLRPLKVKE